MGFYGTHVLVITLLCASVLFTGVAIAGSSICVARTECTTNEIAINLSIYDRIDSHARNDTLAPFKICCPSYYSSGSQNLCSPIYDATLLNLYSEESHANKPDSPWNTRLCLLKPTGSPAVITYNSSDCRIRSNCGSGELCLASLYQLTDSHVGECGAYSNNVCCCPSGYAWDGDKCSPAATKCADIPNDNFYCGQSNTPGSSCSPTNYTKCCYANDPAVAGANYSAWKTGQLLTVNVPGESIKACNQIIRCGATLANGQPDGVCPNNLVGGFTCNICDSDCEGNAVCNNRIRGTSICNSACNPLGPFAAVDGAPGNWINTQWNASVLCSPNGVACDPSTYGILIDQTTLCSGNYSNYTPAGSGVTIDSHGFVCATAKDTVGTAGFSLPVESLVDKSLPAAYISISADPPAINETIIFSAVGDDFLSGIDTEKIYIDGVLVNTCNYGGGTSQTCQYQISYPTPGSHVYYTLITDVAGNSNQTSNQSFTLSACDAADFTIFDVTPNPAKLTDNITITIDADTTLIGNPIVSVTPGISQGYSQSYLAMFKSKTGNRYEYTFYMDPSYPQGRAKIIIQGTSDSCATTGTMTGYFDVPIGRTLIADLQFIPDSANVGQPVYGIFSCNVTFSGVVEDNCKNTDTQVNDIRISGQNYLLQEITGQGDDPNDYFMSNYIATDGTEFTNVWVFPVDTNIYRSLGTITARYLPLGLSDEASDTYNVVSTSYIDIAIEFPDVTNNIVPLTLSGVPNITRSMPIKVKTDGTIITGGGNQQCDDSACDATISIDGGPYTPMIYDPYEKSFKNTSSSAELTCEHHTATIKFVKISDPLIQGLKNANFFVSCTPTITVTPLESRTVVGDHGIKVFDVSIWNPTDANTYTLKMETVNPPTDLVVLNFLDLEGDGDGNHIIDAIPIAAISSATRQVSLDSNTGAGRSGAFGLKFIATDIDGNNYVALSNLLIFAEGLDEFALWQLVVLMMVSLIVYLKYNDSQKGGNKKYIRNPHTKSNEGKRNA